VESRDCSAVFDGPSGGAERYAGADVPVLARRLPAGREFSRILCGVSPNLIALLLEPIGYLPPAEYEARYYGQAAVA
jgi:hypothetical protein